MNIESIFPGIRGNNQNKVNRQASIIKAVLGNNEAVKILEAGQKITGEILSNDGTKLTLKLPGNMILNARMEQSVAAGIGENVSFLVKSNDGGTIALTPLMENLAGHGTATKALHAAGLPVNDRTMAMTLTMMEEGMGINKQNLIGMYTRAVAHADIEVTRVVQMSALDIPLNEANAEQFVQYKNFEGLLNSSFGEVLDMLPQAIDNLAESGTPKEMMNLLEHLVLATDSNISEQGGGYLSDSRIVNADESVAVQNSYITANENSVQKEEGNVFLKNLSDAVTAFAGIEENEESVNVQTSIGTEVQYDDNGVPLSIFPKGTMELANLFGSMGDTLTENGLLSNDISDGQILAAFAKLVGQVSDSKANPVNSAQVLKSIFTNDRFKELFKENILKQIALKPDELSKENMVKLYERMINAAKHLSEGLENVGKGTEIARAVNEIKSNLNFIDNLHQMYNFVQIPIKMSNNRNAGELYVYTSKKSLANKEGKTSAYLHLDMEYLGVVNCYVKLNSGNKITTNFYLEDEKSLDLIEKNLPLLTKRLQDRGFQMMATAQMEDRKNDVMDMLNEKENKPVSLSHLTFDVRA